MGVVVPKHIQMRGRLRALIGEDKELYEYSKRLFWCEEIVIFVEGVLLSIALGIGVSIPFVIIGILIWGFP